MRLSLLLSILFPILTSLAGFTANSYQTKPNFFVKAPLRGAFTKKLVVGLFAICCMNVTLVPRSFENRYKVSSAILILKPILSVAAPTALQHSKLVF